MSNPKIVKPNLPNDWIVVNSESHPDRVYYFNVRTNKSSWEQPLPEETNMVSRKKARNSKKRKRDSVDDDSTQPRPTTPVFNETNQTISTERLKLCAKRQITKSTDQVDTPQMREIREKLLKKQSKNVTPKKVVPNAVKNQDEPDKKILRKEQPVSAKPVESTKSVDTPQMLALYEKIRQRQSKVTGKRSVSSAAAEEAKSSENISTTTSEKNNEIATRKRATRVRKVSETVKKIVSPVVPCTPRGKRRTDVGSSSTEQASSTSESPVISEGIARTKSEKSLARRGRSLASKEMISESPPSVYKNAEVRLKSLHNRILKRQSAASDNRHGGKKPIWDDERQELPEKHGTTVASLIEECSNVEFCEEMEWEPIEDEKIMVEVQSVRMQLCTDNPSDLTKEMPENVLRFSNTFDRKSNQELYIVIDTNVFLSNLEAIEQARDAIFKSYGRPFIVVPWTVLRELDYIKDNRSMTKSPSLQAKARRAVRFLYQHFSAKHPRVKGQTPADVADNKEKFALECPDDEILQSCLQIREAGNSVILLSYDKNLCNKAMVHDVATLGRNDPLEKVDYLNASENQSESSLRFHLQDDEDQLSDSVSNLNEELRISGEILDELKTVLKSFLCVIVAKEMQNLFGDHWEKYTIIRPPWSVTDVLKCAVKHWMAAVSESFLRRAESILKELLEIFNNLPERGHTLKDVSNILERCNDLIQTVKIDKYPNLMVSASKSIEGLKKKCLDNTKRIYEEKLQEKIGFENDALEEERKAENAFQYFEEVYLYTRNLCGLAAESIGMPCAFSYQKPDPMPSMENLKQIQPELAANLNRLLHTLSAALEQVNGLYIDHHVLIGLHQALLNFLPELSTKVSRDLTPLDLHCCLKRKEKLLRAGLGQLQELSGYFCRMAGYTCT